MSREEWWSHDATHTLIHAWGSLYLSLNRGHLRQSHWLQVADAVNLRHRRVSDVQCKNRIDTLKKKYKIELARVSPPSQWPFFTPLHRLINDSESPESPEPESSESPEPESPPVRALSWSVPVGPRSKRRRRSEGLGELARAVERLGETYERVEGAKQRQAVELEKQRMQFASDLEYHRMQLFADTQLQLHKARRRPDTYS